MRQQRTLRHAIGCAGVGLHSGARVALTLRPAAEGWGIRVRRVDRPGMPVIPARVHNAVATDGTTSLGHHPSVRVRMVEHLMAALSACEIDNLLVDISGPELPVMDGSARPFVLLIECAGMVEQDQAVARLEVLRPVSVSSAVGMVRLEPARTLELAVHGAASSSWPPFVLTVSPEVCKSELVGARARCASDRAGDERFVNEGARHEALDALGDLALLPARLHGRYVASNASAELRCELLRRLVANSRNWRLTGKAQEHPDWPAFLAGPPRLAQAC